MIVETDPDALIRVLPSGFVSLVTAVNVVVWVVRVAVVVDVVAIVLEIVVVMDDVYPS